MERESLVKLKELNHKYSMNYFDCIAVLFTRILGVGFITLKVEAGGLLGF